MDTFFTNLEILDSKICNIYCDQILSHMREHFSYDEKFTNKFVVSGRLSYNLQEELDTPIKNIVFITDDIEMFQYYQLNAKQISTNNKGIVNFKKRTLLYLDGLFIEVWYTITPLSFVLLSDLPLQLTSQIPAETL